MELLESRDKVIATVVVVGVAEDLDVGMEGFQSMLGVLRAVSVVQRSGCVVRYPTIEFTILLVSSGPPYMAQRGLLTCQGLGHLLVHNYVDLYAALSRSLEHLIQAVALIAGRGATQVQFRTTECQPTSWPLGLSRVAELPQPPVQDVDVFSSL